ncbi:MAG: hypothetical protein KGJ24_01510 [Burkholderiales bacterium]|nr:hypothetical protein [Burkholderiales bacterium]
MFDMLPYFAGALLLLIWFRVERSAAQLSALQEQLAGLRRDLGLAPALSVEPSRQVRDLAVDSKRTLEAIKAYRADSGADVKRARQVIEQLRSGRGDV